MLPFPGMFTFLKRNKERATASWHVVSGGCVSCVEHHTQPPCLPIHSSAPCHSRLDSTLRESIILMRGRLQRVGGLRYPLPCAPSLSTPILCPTCSLFWGGGGQRMACKGRNSPMVLCSWPHQLGSTRG